MDTLECLLRADVLPVHFQPVVCLKQRRLMGLEALACPPGLSHGELAALALASGRSLQLDRLCRRNALKAYSTLRLPQPERPLLFLNFQASVIDEGAEGSGVLLDSVLATGLDPGDIVIEVNESQVVDTSALITFVERHRGLGFQIALDDMGVGHSNLARIAQLQPHLIKLDRLLIAGIQHDVLKQELMRSLVHLCQGIGSAVLAEGVETLEEAEACDLLGAELQQGYFYAYPSAPERIDLGHLQPAIDTASRHARRQALKAIRSRRLRSRQLEELADGCRQVLLGCAPDGFDAALAALVRLETLIEAAYVIDAAGCQISDTHLGQAIARVPGRLFAPAIRGANHSHKEYFYGLLAAGQGSHLTGTYISRATGRPCRTLATRVEHRAGGICLLCLDLKPDS